MEVKYHSRAYDHLLYPAYIKPAVTRPFMERALAVMEEGRTNDTKELLVGTGTSGAYLGGLAAYLDPAIHYVHLRKDDERTHRTMLHINTIVEENGVTLKFLSDYKIRVWIIDDTVDSGKTMKHIISGLKSLIHYASFSGEVEAILTSGYAEKEDSLSEHAEKLGITIKTWHLL